MILETKRTYLRELTQNDFDDLCMILQDKEVTYAYDHDFTDEEVQAWLEKNLKRYKDNGHGFWAVIDKETGAFLGQCGLTIQDINDKQYLEIGYLFKKAYWHKGYATETAIACKKYAFNVLKADKVYSIIRDTNIPSQNVAKRVGMEKIEEVTKNYNNADMLHYVYEIKNII